MTTQAILVALAAAAAAAYLARLAWTSWSSSGCGKGCGTSCAPPPTLVTPDDLTARVKGRASGGGRTSRD